MTHFAFVRFHILEGHLTTFALYHTVQTFNDPEKRRLLKTLWENEKMLVTSIFSFSRNVFYQSKISPLTSAEACEKN